MALNYFRRFFLKKTILDYHPEKVMLASIFIAYKVGQVGMDKNTMLLKFRDVLTAEELLDFEFVILYVINYDMNVYCPYKALVGVMNLICVVLLN